MNELSTVTWIWFSLATGAGAALFAVLSALLERSGPIRLSHWAEEAGGSLQSLYASRLRFGVFRSLLSWLARLAPLALLAALAGLFGSFGWRYPIWTSLAFVAAGLAMFEAANRALVFHDPERALSAFTRGYRLLYFFLAPLVVLVSLLIPARALLRRDEDDPDERVSDGEIEAFIDVGKSEGILEPEAEEMVWSIVGFADSQVRSVMTPRVDMVCLSAASSLDALAERFVESGHSRIPLYEGSIDKIVGILHIRDVLRAQRLPSPPPDARSLVRPPLLVPETKPLGELLRELQRRFQQVAIVVDEHGGTSGLVTMEDLVEEIVGEIADEHEVLAADLAPLANGVYRIGGRARLALLDELFQVRIEEAEFETVAGLVLSVLGRIPSVGDSVEVSGIKLTVDAMAARRIQTLLIERAPIREEEEE